MISPDTAQGTQGGQLTQGAWRILPSHFTAGSASEGEKRAFLTDMALSGNPAIGGFEVTGGLVVIFESTLHNFSRSSGLFPGDGIRTV